MTEPAETLEQKLERYATVIGLQREEIDRLRAVVAKLTEGTDDAHSTLRRIYLDETESSNARIKAAQASINFEKSRLENVPPPLNLVAEQHESLADIVTRQRARADAMQPKLIEQTIKDNEAAARAWRNGGNGRDDNTGS